MKKVDQLQDKVDDDRSTSQLNLLKDEGDQTVYKELKKIWSELLGEDVIHSEDDFNSLGGESLLAIQMMNMVKKRIGFQLEIADTFGYPTLGALAEFITAELRKDQSLDGAAAHKISGKFLCTHINELIFVPTINHFALGFLYRLRLSNSLLYLITYYYIAFEITKKTNIDCNLVPRSCDPLVEEREALG